jgi:Ca2+-transporting ATPase
VRPGGDDLPVAFAGTLVVRGQGIGEVIATGVASEIGKIGKSLASLTSETPHLQRQMQRLVRIFALTGLVISLLVVALYVTQRGGWLDAVLAGIAVGMSMLPEEFPVVLAVTLAMGAWRISQARVLTRRSAAIESLGATTVLCTDKTGTLTENRMQVAALQPSHDSIHAVDAQALPAALHELVQTAVLASAREPFDPMEKAFHQLAAAQAPLAGDYTLVKTYALRPELLVMSQAWRTGATDEALLIAAKGAPEAIATLCRLDSSERQALQNNADAMAAAGLRVLGLATVRSATLPASQQDLHFTCLGLVGLADPLRSSVPAAVAECRRAGIRVVMITGDYPATARAIARDAGLAADDVLTGSELALLDDAALAQRARTTTVFARIMPEQKLRIVNALKADGEVVTMTGDGVNDAPSLKAAHIGVAMGGRGTDVAREASSLVLLDDDFGSIVTTVQLGRRIYDNLRKAVNFILAVHVPIAGLALLPLFSGLPLLLGPVHIAFLEMVIDPVCSLVFEAETGEPDLMRRPPRDPKAALLTPAMAAWALLQGVLALALVAGFYLIALHRGMPTDEVRALCFFSLVLCIVVMIFVNRSASASLVQAFRRRNRALAWVLAVIAAMLALTQWLPMARDLFHFGPLHADDLALVLGAGIALLLVLEALKPLWRKPLGVLYH